MNKLGFLIIIAAASSIGWSAEGSLVPKLSGRIEQAVEVGVPGGSRVLTAVETLVDVKYFGNKPGRGNLLVVFDSASGYFVSHLSHGHEFPGRPHVPFLTDGFRSGRMYGYLDRD